MAELKPGWQRVKFGDVVRLNKETCKDPEAAGIERVIGLEHLEPGDLRIRSWGHVADGTTFTNRVRPGQVLFGKRRAYQRKVAVANFNAVCSGDIYVLEVIDRKRLLPGLLPFVCQTNTFYNHAIGTSAGSLSPRTNWRNLSECDIALPSLEEQAQLETLLRAAHSSLECILLASDELTKVEQLAFEWLLLASPAQAESAMPSYFGRIPGHWQLKPVCEVGEVAYGISAAVSDNTDRGIGWPILTGANLTLKGEIDSSKLVYHPAPSKSSFILKANDILLNWRSGSPEHIGKTALFNLEGDWTYASFILRLRPNDDSNPVYLWRLFNFMRARGLFLRGTSQQVNFKMNAAHFRQIEIACPPRQEQDAIVEEMQGIWVAEQEMSKRVYKARRQLHFAIQQLEGEL